MSRRLRISARTADQRGIPVHNGIYCPNHLITCGTNVCRRGKYREVERNRLRGSGMSQKN